MGYNPDDIPRCPDSLLPSDLPDWCKLIWLAVRKVQGSNVWAFAHFSTYAEMCGKDRTQGSQAVKILCDTGWLERDGKRVRCLLPALEVDDAVDHSSRKVDHSSTSVPEKVDHSSTPVDHSSSRVDHSSTATESYQRTQSINPERERTREEDLILVSPLERAIEKAQAPVEIYRVFLGEWMHRNNRPGRPTVPERFQTLIAHAVKDREAWESHLFRWLETGYQMLNVTALLDAYDEAELAVRAPPPPETNSYDASGSRSAADALYEELAAGMNQPE